MHKAFSAGSRLLAIFEQTDLFTNGFIYKRNYFWTNGSIERSCLKPTYMTNITFNSLYVALSRIRKGDNITRFIQTHLLKVWLNQEEILFARQI